MVIKLPYSIQAILPTLGLQLFECNDNGAYDQ